MPEQCCALLMNNTDLCSLLFTPHVPTKKKKEQKNPNSLEPCFVMISSSLLFLL